MQLRPWGLIAYDRIEWPYGRKKKDSKAITLNNRSSQNNTVGVINSYTGKLTPYAKKKLKRAIGLLVASAKDKEAQNWKTGKIFKFKINFITLTLPASQGTITDKQLKKEVLDVWIKRMRRKHKLNNYVWRAERQKNGNIHFHLISDTYIHYEKIRNDWNACLAKFNFIDDFEKKNGHRNPNSTDVHAIWKVKNLVQYFVKYMAKDEKEGDFIEGKVWDCSKALKTKENVEKLMESETAEIWNKAYNDNSTEKKHDTNYTLIFLPGKLFRQFITGQLLKDWNTYLEKIRLGNHPEDIPISA